MQCAALFWDYLAEHPACAGVLMREAFYPDEAVAEVVQGHARRVVKLAVSFIEAAQEAGQLAAFDVRRFLLRLASFTITFHAAPTMRRSILGAQRSFREERDAFLASLRAEVAVGGGSSSDPARLPESRGPNDGEPATNGTAIVDIAWSAVRSRSHLLNRSSNRLTPTSGRSVR